MAAPEKTEDILDVNRRYHDVAAAEYDVKWGVDFGEIGRTQVLGKVEKLLGRNPGPFDRSLEIGVRHGLLQPQPAPGGGRPLGGLHRRLARHARDAARERGAARPRRRDGRLRRRRPAVPRRVVRPRPRPRGPAPPARARPRVRRVPPRAAPRRRAHVRRRALPPRRPDRRRPEARRPRRRAALAPARRRRPRADAHADGHGEPDDHALESMVDVHAFTPGDLERHARAAGFEGVRVRGEELLANWFGWFNRTVEATARHEEIPRAWFQYAYHGYIALQKVDAACSSRTCRRRASTTSCSRPASRAEHPGLRASAACPHSSSSAPGTSAAPSCTTSAPTAGRAPPWRAPRRASRGSTASGSRPTPPTRTRCAPRSPRPASGSAGST